MRLVPGRPYGEEAAASIRKSQILNNCTAASGGAYLCMRGLFFALAAVPAARELGHGPEAHATQEIRPRRESDLAATRGARSKSRESRR